MFVAVRDLKFAKGRFALMGAVIVLITVLVGLVSGLTAGLARQNVSAVTGLPANEIAFGTGGATASYTDSTVTGQQWRAWAATPGVTSAQPLGISTVKAARGTSSTAVTAFGIEPGSPLAPDSGHVSGHAAVASAGAARALGLAPGTSLTLAGLPVTIAAIGPDASFSHTPVIWISLALWQSLDTPAGAASAHAQPTATVIALNTRPGTDLAAAEHATDTTVVAKNASLSAIGSYTAENGSLQLMRGFLFAISALVVGAFFTVWTIQRSGDIAILKALGAGTFTLLKDALGQALVLLLAGTAAGTAIAVTVGTLAAGSTVPFTLTPATALPPAAVMIALGTLGAAASVRRVTSIDPLTALGSVR